MPGATVELFEAHEERIQRLEQGVQELSTGLATNTAKLEALGDKMDLSVDLIGHKIDKCVAPLSARLEAHIVEDEGTKQDVERALGRIDRDRRKIERLEESAVAEEKRSKKFWRVVLPFALAASGWFGRHIWGILFHK